MLIESPAEGVRIMKKSVIMFALADAGLNEKQLNRVADYIAQCDEWQTVEHIKGMIEDPASYYDVIVKEIRSVWHDACYESKLRKRLRRGKLPKEKYYGIGGEFASPLAFMASDHHNARYALLRGIARYNQGVDALARHMVTRHKSWITYNDIITMEIIIEESGMPSEEMRRQLSVLHKIEKLLFE